ncbi:hypothetical protein A3B45_05460 [Candidatus Daviesbacteria bacterium RIFCSPLOWO2_01_FULL_39_12]|uniref:PDZ domain-containing protein n=1 Tax=Candidatus Daviesbacteria bacterium RIFCSPLOWO2_01_FULL_39_12 TaxID=1797785 RepID=A0A1F5KTQ1_9BACT|nr:MAG: hypothetical protein A3D79_03520 [Candidatus Daviesbacteria bacterium RIFCSPHIGHO2_02_FULL_39_8]OGE44195.1 MAG: hypothetical protein A3B45_05460 [Candidatus Daviesbacteria bacterium RIFCSPLOWO2_01_FULL_39_12]
MKNLVQKINPMTVLIAILAFLVGWQLGHADLAVKWSNYKPSLTIENQEPPQNINVDFQLFWKVWDLVSREYIDKQALDPQKLFYGAISGMVSAIGDPYTFFLPPDVQKTSKEELNGAFEGVGIQLGFNKDKRLIVIAPLEGTPAKRAGIKPADLIIKIGDQDTIQMSLADAVKLIRGPKGTTVKLTILSEEDGESREVALTRETILVKSVEVSFKQTSSSKLVALIKLSRFGERTTAEWNEAIADVLSRNTQAVILDLRNNPGGLLDGAVFIASEFLDNGVVVLQENNQGERVSASVNRNGKLTKIPMVVIINKGSASASEIVAGSLQDRKRARLVGEKSFGKGTIQAPEELEGGAGVHITIAKWLTPNGRWVNDTQGLEPDILVEAPKNETEVVTEDQPDPQLDKAMELLE